ncbi:MAG: DUF222 domain-containing protein [Propionibacteriales bacterium]|nr:DUF222 domain-containing protein [Propionibacteriales bacterium]
MFESDPSHVSGQALSAAGLRAAAARLGDDDLRCLSEAEHIDRVAAMEDLKSALAAAQARDTAALAAKRAAAEAAAGVPIAQRCRGLAAEVALARRESPVRGARSLGLAQALVSEMPHTLAALTAGEISEWRATLLVRETAVLRVEDRAQVDADLAGRLGLMGDRQVAAQARAIGYRLDPASVLRRVRGATSDRRVSLRPAPDTMTYLTGFLPVAQGVACLVALTRHADTLRAGGDERSKGQIMADTLVARVTGQQTATGTPVEVQLVMADTTLLGNDHAPDDTPAHLVGYGPVPAAVAREITLDAAQAWIRRLYLNPADGALVAMESRRRVFDGGLRRFVIARDQFCRTTWCDAVIRHIDHLQAAAATGATSAENGQGVCEACNYTKEATGWKAERTPGQPQQITITTPTGHQYAAAAPQLPGHRRSSA